MKKLIFHWMILMTFGCHSFSFAQSLIVKAEADTTMIRIGEQVRLRLSALFSQPSTREIKWPQIGDTITSSIEVVSKSGIDTQTVASGKKIYSQEITITSFDSGYHAIPPFAFTIKDDTSNIAETEALLLEVQTIPVDTTQAIRDIKGPVDAPFTWKEAIPYMIIAGIVIAAIVLAVYLYKKLRKKKPLEQKPEIVRSPDETALEQIQILEKEKLWQNGRIKEYYIRLSDILRIYTEQRFRIPAMEQTSDELLTSLRTIVKEEQRVKLRQILLLSDLVKFAKELPIGTENEISLVNAKEFIAETKPAEIAGTPKEKAQ